MLLGRTLRFTLPSSILGRFGVTARTVESTRETSPPPGVCVHQTTRSPGWNGLLGMGGLRVS